MLELTFSPSKEIFYVGEEVSVKITATRNFDLEVIGETYSFEVKSGELPPDCELKQYGYGVAYITGKLTRAGNYDFTVWVTLKGLLRSVYGYSRAFEDAGSITRTMYILTPEPDPSKDIPAPVPNPKPQAVGVIANKLGISSADVEYVASSDMKAVQPPTASITNALSSDGGEIISTQGSITAQKTGCYVFPLTVPADLVGTNTELKVYLADRNIFSGASFRPSALPAGITEAQIFTESGGTVTTLPGNILVAANLQAR